LRHGRHGRRIGRLRSRSWSLSLSSLPLACRCLAAGQNLRSRLGNLAFQFVEFLLDDFLVVGKVRFQPLEGAGVILGLEVFLEFIELLVGHLVGQTDTDAHFQRFVDMFEEAVLFGGGQRCQADFFK
jgi:hypothetical protein